MKHNTEDIATNLGMARPCTANLLLQVLLVSQKRLIKQVSSFTQSLQLKFGLTAATLGLRLLPFLELLAQERTLSIGQPQIDFGYSLWKQVL